MSAAPTRESLLSRSNVHKRETTAPTKIGGLSRATKIAKISHLQCAWTGIFPKKNKIPRLNKKDNASSRNIGVDGKSNNPPSIIESTSSLIVEHAKTPITARCRSVKQQNKKEACTCFLIIDYQEKCPIFGSVKGRDGLDSQYI